MSTLVGNTEGGPVKKIVVTGSNNAPYFMNSGEAVYDHVDAPYSKQLRAFVSQHQFPTEESSETKFAVNVLRWVNQQWEHDGANEPPKDSRALEILQNVYGKKEKYRCVEFGIVLSQALNAYGFITRTLALRTPNVAYGGFGQGHVAAEAWINELGKWIFMDGQFGATVTRAEDDTPLNYYEIYLEKKSGRWKELRFHFVDPKDQGKAAEYSKFLSDYFGHLSVSAGKDKPLISLRLEAKDTPVTFQGFASNNVIFTDDPKLLYPEMNRVSVFLRYSEEKRNVNERMKFLRIETNEDFLKHQSEFAAVPDYTVHFLSNTPLFGHYEYRFDTNAKWIKAEKDEVHWNASTSARSRFEVRAVNLLGRNGPVTWIDLEYR